MDAQFETAPRFVGDGVEETPWMGSGCATVISAVWGSWQEVAKRGYVYHVSTAVAGVAPGTALSTTPPFCLWNPSNSGRYMSVLRTSLGYVSGTLGAGSIVYAVVPAQPSAPTGGAALTPQSGLLGGQALGVGKAFQASTVASTPAILKPIYNLSAFLATTAVAPAPIIDLPDGELVLAPGAAFVMQGVAAGGSTPLVMFGVTWVEVPLSVT